MHPDVVHPAQHSQKFSERGFCHEPVFISRFAFLKAGCVSRETQKSDIFGKG